MSLAPAPSPVGVISVLCVPKALEPHSLAVYGHALFPLLDWEFPWDRLHGLVISASLSPWTKLCMQQVLDYFCALSLPPPRDTPLPDRQLWRQCRWVAGGLNSGQTDLG